MHRGASEPKQSDCIRFCWFSEKSLSWFGFLLLQRNTKATTTLKKKTFNPGVSLTVQSSVHHHHGETWQCAGTCGAGEGAESPPTACEQQEDNCGTRCSFETSKPTPHRQSSAKRATLPNRSTPFGVAFSFKPSQSPQTLLL